LSLDRFRIETCIKEFEYLAVVADHSRPPASRLNYPDGSCITRTPSMAALIEGHTSTPGTKRDQDLVPPLTE